MKRGRKPKTEVVIMPDGRAITMPRPGNIQELSSVFIGALQEDFYLYGRDFIVMIREKFPELYFSTIAKMVSVLRVQMDVKHSGSAKTEEEIIKALEARIGPEGVREWLKFKERVKALEAKQSDMGAIDVSGDEEGGGGSGNQDEDPEAGSS